MKHGNITEVMKHKNMTINNHSQNLRLCVQGSAVQQGEYVNVCVCVCVCIKGRFIIFMRHVPQKLITCLCVYEIIHFGHMNFDKIWYESSY
jgi:hypothetical protein